MTILVLISKHERSWSVLKDKILAYPHAKRFLLCPVNSDLDETVAEISQFIHAHTPAESAIIPFSRRLLEHSLQVKDEYIRYISALGNREISKGVNLKEYFRYPSADFSTWWLSLVYEKSPGKTDAFLHFCKLSLIVTLVREKACDELWLSCTGENSKYFEALSGVRGFKISTLGPAKKNSGGVGECAVWIKEGLRVLRYFLFLLGVRLCTGLYRRPVLPPGCRRFVITMFPFFDAKKFDEGRFYSKAYGPLQDGLENDRSHPFAWLAMHTKIEPYSWRESRDLAGKAKKFTPNFFSVDEWIGLKDILRIDLDFLRFAARFAGVYKRLPQLTSWIMAENCPVNFWPFIREDFISSFAGKVAVVNWHHLRIFLNIARDLPEGSRVIHFAEMHCWERCLQVACGLRGDIRVIALQHAHVPQMLLNYFDDQDDLTDENFVRSVPQPDFLGSVGTVIQGYFSKQGWPQSKLFVIGGFRFHSLGLGTAQADKKTDGKQIMVAAFSICYNENLEMLRMLFRVFNDGALGLKILIKSHPAESVEKMAVKEGILLDKKIFEFTDIPLEKIVPHACAMFACSTSSIFYAMACHKPVIVPCLYDAIDLCPLTNLYPYETRVDSRQQLKNAVIEIIEGRYDQSRHEKLWNRLRDDYLCLAQDTAQNYKNLDNYLKR